MLRPGDREILRLAVPAFLALVAEPLFLLADAAIVGHLGTAELAALGVAGAVVTAAVGLCIFLAYGTTASVARRLGAGDTRGALNQGIDGLWLAVLIGVPATLAGIAGASRLTALFGAGGEVGGLAADYLRIALLGLTPLLVMLAATGVLRGLQDTRTPLVVAVGGNLLNIALNLLLVYGAGPVPGFGLRGSAAGSVAAQVVMAVVLVAVVARAARREGAPLTPDRAGIAAAARSGVPLVVRTVTLRIALLLTVVAAARVGGDAELAAHQLAFTLWSFLAYALDALAIAAQAITGRRLGAGDAPAARAATRRMTQWGVGFGVVTGVLLAVTAGALPQLFSPDPRVHDALVPVLLVAAAAQPLAGYVFVLDGVLIGAGDGRYLAGAGLVVLLVYAPLTFVVGSLVGLWLAFGFGFMAARGVVLGVRARGERWMALGLRP